MKLKIIIILILFNNYIYNIQTNQEKYVIGTNNKWGFFASFFNTLNHIIWCELNNKTPVVWWNEDSLYYDKNGYNGSTNAWEYYFEQVSNLTYNPGDIIHNNYLTPFAIPEIPMVFQNCFISGKLKARYVIKNYINKYIKIKYSIILKFNEFYLKNMNGKKTIGIHLRGTDKSTEYKSVDPTVLLTQANKYRGYQYLIATDEEKLLNLAKKMLKGKVIYYNSLRSKDGSPVHFNNIDKPKSGEDILIEVMLLSICDKFIHTCSNVPIAVLCFNPDLENIVFAPI